MTGFFKGKAVSQVDAILVDGQRFEEKQLKEILKEVKADPNTKQSKGKK